MYTPDVREKIERELAQAERARSAGNEGQARVCARRAAGAALGAFFRRRGHPASSSPSAIDLLNQARETPGLPERAVEVVDHLLMRVTPDYKLPLPVDLLGETRWLVSELERISPPGEIE